MASSPTYKKKDLHITSGSALPPHKIKSIASWGSKAVFNRMDFRNWNATTREGKRNTIFSVNPYSPDYLPT